MGRSPCENLFLEWYYSSTKKLSRKVKHISLLLILEISHTSFPLNIKFQLSYGSIVSSLVFLSSMRQNTNNSPNQKRETFEPAINYVVCIQFKGAQWGCEKAYKAWNFSLHTQLIMTKVLYPLRWDPSSSCSVWDWVGGGKREKPHMYAHILAIQSLMLFLTNIYVCLYYTNTLAISTKENKSIILHFSMT